MKESLSVQIGKRVRSRREELGLTRESLAELADVSVSFISEVESGKKSMTTNTLAKVAPALCVSTDFLVFGSNERPEPSEIEQRLAKLTKRDRKFADELLSLFIDAMAK